MDGLGSASPPVAPTATTGEGRHPCTWPRTFWFKPLSAFGLLDLTTFISSSPELAVSNSERGYHVFSDVGTKLEFVGFNEAVHVRVATDIFSRIGLTRCLSDPYIPSAGCADLIS